jgi:peptide/nickel transport system ATP-binding protein
MCRGYIVEKAPKASLFRNPVHPYTQALLAAVPEPDIDRPLDFAKLRSDRFSNPLEWPERFRLTDFEPGSMVEIEADHYVRLPGGETAKAA